MQARHTNRLQRLQQREEQLMARQRQQDRTTCAIPAGSRNSRLQECADQIATHQQRAYLELGQMLRQKNISPSETLALLLRVHLELDTAVDSLYEIIDLLKSYGIANCSLYNEVRNAVGPINDAINKICTAACPAVANLITQNSKLVSEAHQAYDNYIAERLTFEDKPE